MEDLNIDRMRKRLILKALNKFKFSKDAAMALGISERQLFRLKVDYGIIKKTSCVWISTKDPKLNNP